MGPYDYFLLPLQRTRGTNAEDLQNCFGEYGMVVDAYVATKKDKAGNRFGFVIFDEAKDKLDLEQQLKEVNLNHARLVVNLARFNKYGKPIREVSARGTHYPQFPQHKQGNEGACHGGHTGERTCINALLKNQARPPAEEVLFLSEESGEDYSNQGSAKEFLDNHQVWGRWFENDGRHWGTSRLNGGKGLSVAGSKRMVVLGHLTGLVCRRLHRPKLEVRLLTTWVRTTFRIPARAKRKGLCCMGMFTAWEGNGDVGPKKISHAFQFMSKRQPIAQVQKENASLNIEVIAQKIKPIQRTIREIADGGITSNTSLPDLNFSTTGGVRDSQQADCPNSVNTEYIDNTMEIEGDERIDWEVQEMIILGKEMGIYLMNVEEQVRAAIIGEMEELGAQ
ncbi:hypothetical protein L1987_13608 [Smallanthus sonchifolius]|uniref:Uncharacterized protein n=1 Tax=Smallanthus sonchifolius TaxID=185202 RepID=A0ACB9JJ29_9ASTR|nr:hypothetical protein L1987_13608 [Smallanthus sonchifolius]